MIAGSRAAVWTTPDLDNARAAWIQIGQRIVDQVGEYLFQGASIAPGGRQVLNRHGRLALFDRALGGGDDVGDERLDVDAIESVFHTPGPGEPQQGVNNTAEPEDGRLDETQ